MKTSGRIINGEKNSKENCESTNGIVKCDGNLLNYERKRKNSCDSGSDTLSEHSVKNTPPGHSGKNNTNCVSLSKNKVSQEMGSRYNENEDEILQKNIIKIAQNNLNASDSGEDDGSGCDNDNNKRKKNVKNNSSEKSKEISSLMHSSLSMNAIFKNDEHNHSRGESSFPLPSCQQGTQRSIRLQSIPPLPLFSPLQPDPSLLMQSKNEHSSSPVSATTSAEKRGASIVLDLVNRASKKSPRVISATNGQNSHFVHGLNDSHSPIMGSSSSSSGSGNGSNSSSNNGNGKEINHLNNSNHGNNNHNNNIINNNGSGNNAELLSISDEEMINFPKNFTDAFNIGDYEGVSKIIIRCIAEDCSLKTPALENDLIGTYVLTYSLDVIYYFSMFFVLC